MLKNMLKIKYDRKDKTRTFRLAIVLTALFLINCLFLLLNTVFSMELSAALEAVTIICFLYLPWLVLIVWLTYLDSVFYLKRLKKYGYEIPISKKAYQYRLDRLPKDPSASSPCNSLCRESVVLSCLFFTCAAILCIPAGIFICKYSFLGSPVYLLWGILLLIILTFFSYGLLCRKQRLQTKYKDDVEMDTKRKTRISLIPGIELLGILMACTYFYIVIMNTAAEYIYKSGLMNG